MQSLQEISHCFGLALRPVQRSTRCHGQYSHFLSQVIESLLSLLAQALQRSPRRGDAGQYGKPLGESREYVLVVLLLCRSQGDKVLHCLAFEADTELLQSLCILPPVEFLHQGKMG